MTMLMIRLAVWCLEQLDALDGSLCRSYGGMMVDGSVRLCGKSRWHVDSHAYEISRWPYRDGGVI